MRHINRPRLSPPLRRTLATSLLALLLSTGIAFANDWGFNQIKSYVDIAERRLGEGDSRSARFHLEKAREMVPNASADAKADKGFSPLQARIEQLDKVIAGKEAGLAKIAESDERLHKAGSQEVQARVQVGYDEYEKAVALYKECSALLEEAAAIDPTVKQRTSHSGPTYAELATKCKAGSAEMAKQASGEGKDASTTKEGKAVLEGYEQAMKVSSAKKLQAMELVAGLKAAESCKDSANHLTSLRLRNGNSVWDGKTTKLGGLALDDLRDKCAKLEISLKSKPAFGCGRQTVSVEQERATIVDPWGAVQTSPKRPFEAMACSEMPKRSVFPGLSAKYKAKYQSVCGADAIYIIQTNDWHTQRTARQMSGECWKKGSLTFHM